MTAAASRSSERLASRQAAIPQWIKLAVTLYFSVLVPVYYEAYGPAQAFYFCDVSFFIAVLGLVTESDFVLSVATISTLLPMGFWNFDFFAILFFGVSPSGMTLYMFDERIPLFTRALSCFHLWLPVLLLELLAHGYFRYIKCAFDVACLNGALIFLISYEFLPPPDSRDPNMAQNVNYAFGIGDRPQTWVGPYMWLLLAWEILVCCFYLPGQMLLTNEWSLKALRCNL